VCQKDSGSDSATTPVPRTATAPSPHLRSVYSSTLPRAKTWTASPSRPPRRRLVVSSETIQEGGPFTIKQVAAATSFTTGRTREDTASELPATLAIEALPEDNDVQASLTYLDQATQVNLHYQDQSVQSTLPNEPPQRTPKIPPKPSEAKGKRASHNQACQTEHDLLEISSGQGVSESPVLVLPPAESKGSSPEAPNTGHIVINENPESHSSTDFAFFTAKNCSSVSQARRSGSLDAGISLDPNTITIEFPEGAKVHMLQRILGGKIVIDPGTLPRARSIEALAQGEVYTPSCAREQKSKLGGSSRSLSSASSSSRTSLPKIATKKALGTAEGSHYYEARQHLSSQVHQSVDNSDRQQEIPKETEVTRPTGEAAVLSTRTPEPPVAVDSSEHVARPTRVNNKRKASPAPYWFESEDDNCKGVVAGSPARPRTPGQLQSVPLIVVQRPSTDSDMGFGIGTKAVKSTPLTALLAPVAAAPAVLIDQVGLPPTILPMKVHFRNRLKRKGRQKLIFRKRVLRFLFGKELAELVSHDLDTVTSTMGGVTGTVQVANDVSGAVLTPVASHIPFAEPALPLGITPLAPAQVDGSGCKSTVSDDGTSATSVDADTTTTISALDGSEERKAKRRAKKEIKLQKKEQERNDEYELAKTNLEALTSTPCIKCGGQRAFILNFVWENKNNMLKHEDPDLGRRARKKAVTEYVESIECRCPRGTTTAGRGSAGAVARAKEMYGCHISSFILARS
jgi:hypothetical protein